MCKGFLAANVPIKKLENPVLRDALETHLGIKLPHETRFREKYVPSIYEETMQEIKEALAEGPLWISVDCSRDPKGREVANVIVGSLDGNEYHNPYLVHVAFLQTADSPSMARYTFLQSLILLWSQTMKPD